MTKEAMDEWLASRPECVRKLAEEFPLGTFVTIDGEDLHLIGYTENDMLMFSPIWPGDDYEASLKAKKYICASHFRTGGKDV